MHVARTIPEMRHHRLLVGSDAPLALVPTMGALHQGHLSLVKLARLKAGARGHVAVSIFVNPLQFNDSADFERYPRTLDADLAMLEAQGVDMVFAPLDDEMYPYDEPPVVVDVPSLTQRLEGAHRPGHFRGVCNVVLRLFNLIQPDMAVFGTKDFQQLRVIETLVDALDLPIDIVRGETLRDGDGLAMSSRNRRLSPRERERALAIPRALDAAAGQFERGETQAAELIETITKAVSAGGPADVPLTLDYVAAVDAERLEPVKTVTRASVLLVAAHVGPVRLIDNRLLSG